MTPVLKARLKLLLLAVIFFAPVLGAMLMFFWFPDWIPSGRVNYGTLVSPARAVPAGDLVDASGAPAPTALQGKWSLVYVAGSACDAACEAQLAVTRQVRLALNEKRLRVQRIYVAPSAAAAAAARAQLAPAHEDLVFVAQPGGQVSAVLQPTEPHAIYLLDPLGNWLMTYGGVIEPKGLHRDVKKLLRASQVG